MSQQTEDRGQKNNDRFSKLLLHGRLAILLHHSQSEQFVLMWTGLEAGSGPLASPVFVKLERRWRIYFQKGLVRLKYIQGLEDIALAIIGHCISVPTSSKNHTFNNKDTHSGESK